MAEVSGPGRFSERTDKAVSAANTSLPNADYGEQAAFQEQAQGAPMAQTAPDFASIFGSMAGQVVGLEEDTLEPDVPVTDGAALGPGAGPEALSSTPQGADQAYFAAYLPALEYIANQPGSSDSARNLVRKIKYSS